MLLALNGHSWSPFQVLGSIVESQIIWNITFVVDNIRIKGAFFFLIVPFLYNTVLVLPLVPRFACIYVLFLTGTFLAYYYPWVLSCFLLFSRSVMSDSLRPHGLQHVLLPCPASQRSLLRLMSIESVMPSNHLILCCPLFLLPLLFPSIRVLSNESALCIRWPKYWSFSFSISPSDEYSELISFRIDWFDLLAV